MNKYALISVYDKSYINNICKILKKFNIKIISTGSTASHIKKLGYKCKDISSLTKLKPMLEGRVKTLHPKIHASLLFKRNDLNHIKNFKKLNFPEISFLIVNLYPFEKYIKTNKDFDKNIEMIDIGGLTLLRSAAKNFKSVTTISETKYYKKFIAEMNKNDGCTSNKFRSDMAAKVFNLTSNYDKNIFKWLKSSNTPKKNEYKLRYGENPNQKAIYVSKLKSNIFDKAKINGKNLSYNNILDIEAAINCSLEFTEPTCIIIKHNNPCGVCSEKNISKAFDKALNADKKSAFGGAVMFNKKLNYALAKKINKYFFEIIIAKSFENNALKLLTQKKNLILINSNKIIIKNKKEFKSTIGGYIIQDKNNIKISKKNLKLMSKFKSSNNKIEDIIFALKVCKHVKSNAIVLVNNKQTIGIGAGQMSRIDSTKIALIKLGNFNNNLKNFIAASDAFFPFIDSIKYLYKKGCKFIVQPKGSFNDKNVINFANKNKISLYFTNERYFKH